MLLARLTMICFALFILFALSAALSPSKANAQTYEYQDIKAIIDATWPSYAEDYAKTIAWRESGYDPYAYNPSGAYCLFQIMPETAYAMGYNYASLADPYYCSAAAADLYQWYGWSPWVTAY